MRAHVTTMRINGHPPSDESGRQSATSGELTIESEFGHDRTTQATVARLRMHGAAGTDDLLPPLVEAKLTELSGDTFALTGVEVRGATRFAQVWYCKVDILKPVVSIEELHAEGGRVISSA